MEQKINMIWKNKKMNALGDSLTMGDIVGDGTIGVPWTNYMEGLTGLSVCRNYGVCGICLSGTDRSAMVNRYMDMDDDADLISVWGGANDFCAGIEIGKIGDTENNTFYGSLDMLIKGLYSKYNGAEMFFITPPKIDKLPLGETYTPNSRGYVLKDYRDAIVRVCDKYSIPVLDLYTYGSMSCYLDSGIYRPDKLHYSNKGYERIARKIAEFIGNL